MADIVIRRCTLRVIRHGGWSWGADRRGLVDRVVGLVPELVAARLAELFGDDEEVEIAEPVRLRIALGAAPFAHPERLKAAIDAAITPERLPAAVRARAASPPARRAPAAPAGPEPVAPGPPGGEGAAAPPSLRELLLRWRSQGDLARRLRGFSEAAASLWLAALLDECRAPGARQPSEEDLLAGLRAIRRRLPAVAKGGAQPAWARLAAAVELTARHPLLPDLDSVRQLLDRVLPPAAAPAGRARHPPGEGAASAPAARAAAAAKAEAPRRPGPPGAARRAAPAARARREMALCSVLPFLVLAMLRRIGWLDVAAAVFQALQLADRGALFAAALAGKLLPPPERGWHRGERALDTIAVFAGLDSAPSPVALEAWSRSAGDGLSPLDGFVAFEIAHGHDAAQPLLVTRAGEAEASWLLFDADGHYPVAWAHDEAALLAALAPFRASVLLVGARAATPRLMRDLRAADFAFATDAPPARGEDWLRLPGAAACWASPGDVPVPRVAAAAMRLPELEAAAAATGLELLALRPAVAPGKAAALDETAALAAGLGLGLLAWSLWRDREPVDPLLALLRLGDLDGTGRITPDALEVRPAVGRRYFDLKAHNLLADIAGVPWLGGRIVRFIGP